jgi:hypothetical protein
MIIVDTIVAPRRWWRITAWLPGCGSDLGLQVGAQLSTARPGDLGRRQTRCVALEVTRGDGASVLSPVCAQPAIAIDVDPRSRAGILDAWPAPGAAS